MTELIFSVIGVVVGVVLTAAFNLLQDRRRARAAALPLRRLLLHELVVGRDDLVMMLASRTWKKVRTSLSTWEQLRPQFAGVASEEEWKLVDMAFRALGVIDLIARRKLETVQAPATDPLLAGIEGPQVRLTRDDMAWILVHKDQVEPAVAVLGGPPPDTDAAQELDERMRRLSQELEETRRAMEKAKQRLEEQTRGWDPERKQKLEAYIQRRIQEAE